MSDIIERLEFALPAISNGAGVHNGLLVRQTISEIERLRAKVAAYRNRMKELSDDCFDLCNGFGEDCDCKKARAALGEKKE